MNLDEQEHKPVLLNEVLKGLKLRPDGIYVDCTFGRGGHSRAILRNLNDQGRLFVFDKDPRAIQHAKRMFAGDSRIVCVHASFTRMPAELERYDLMGAIDGLLFDLGVSSPQLDDPAYGFSFLRDGKLDMRMDPTTGTSAAAWLSRAGRDEIVQVLRQYGEERFAGRIATAIIRAREAAPITTTKQLADIISAAVPIRERDKHPATRSFQAIRIYINRELDELETVLRQVGEVLKPGGRLVVISFHSLEDRIVKRFLRQAARGDIYPPEIPVKAEALRPDFKVIGKPQKPSTEEVEQNPRARSAVLRVGERLAA